MTDWFADLAGVVEGSARNVRDAFAVEGTDLIARATGRRMSAGVLSLPSLADLRADVLPDDAPNHLREIVADVTCLHGDPDNRGALFQVASQFNLLEMPHPGVTPAMGITGYADDLTQGPACAMACGAGTIWRNYFTTLSGGVGQTEVQIDTLADLGQALGNLQVAQWSMRNGYALPTPAGLEAVSTRIFHADAAERDRLCGLLRVGLQADCDVTLGHSGGSGQRVSQVYCSALPVAYSALAAADWEPFARLVLDAAYEATLRIAARVARDSGSRRVFLTLLGGGAFGNRREWIVDAIARAMTVVPGAGLDVVLVSYGRPQPALRPLLNSFAAPG